MLPGSVFLVQVVLTKIFHMLVVRDLHGENGVIRARHSIFPALKGMLIMSVVFALDTVLPAIAPFDVFRIMTLAIVLSGVLTVVTAGYVAYFPERN